MNAVVIVAAGQGTRMGASRDKLFLDILGEPAISHTWRRADAAPSIAEVIVVVRAGREREFQEIAEERVRPTKPFRLVPGGAERQDSVWNGLAALRPETTWVAIQDGARVCTTAELIERTLAAAREHGAAVAARRLVDTIKESEDGQLISRHMDRSRLWAVETPQCFRVDILRRALAAVRERGLHITDDTAACDLIGQPVRLVESTQPNPKLTSPSDLSYIELLLAGKGLRTKPS